MVSSFFMEIRKDMVKCIAMDTELVLRKSPVQDLLGLGIIVLLLY